MNKMSKKIICLIVAVAILSCSAAFAGWGDVLKKAGEDMIKEKAGISTSSTSSTSSAGSLASITSAEAIRGLKAALDKAVDVSLNQLGAVDGFLKNPAVAIPVPESMQKLDTALQLVGKGDLVDNFVQSMNSAAEKAAPETKDIFLNAIKNMSIDDAKGILKGSDTAATEFFEKNTRGELQKIVMPVIIDATDSVNVTKYYKMLAQAAQVAGYAPGSIDLDQYVADKTLDGVFTVMAEEERKIRKNPVERTSEILKKVFGAI